MTSPILLVPPVPTKLLVPELNLAWIRREQLLARLTMLPPTTRVTLIVAPAGFGKTTLVAQWVREMRARGDAAQLPPAARPAFAWLTLDEYDQDAARFLAYVASAIEQTLPAALPVTRPLLVAHNPPPLYVLLQALLVDLNTLAAPLTLILDDYHTIMGEPIHQVLAYLVRHLPPLCHLMILSRTDPPLTLVRLRATQQLTEVREADLRFTDPEATALLTNLLGRHPDAALVAALQNETEGWPLALQLAALANPSVLGSERALPMDLRQIAEYLADEVLDRQPPLLQQALLGLAVPERFCADLAATLFDPPVTAVEAEDLLSQLTHANLFLFPLDADWRWFRFHRLFRDLLLRRLLLAVGKPGLTRLQLRTGRWLAAEGLFEEALRQFLAADEATAAAELVERQLSVNLGRELRAGSPGYWLGLLPPDLSARRPGLALIEARLAAYHTNVPALAAALTRVETLLAGTNYEGPATPWPAFAGDLATLQGSLYYWQGRPHDAIRAFQLALELGPVPILASQALHLLGKAFVAAGRYHEGVTVIQTGATAGSVNFRTNQRVTRALALCGMHAIAGSVDDLRHSAEELAAAVSNLRLDDFWICYAEAYRGRVAYERSDLAAAAEHFAGVTRRKYQINAPIYMGCLIGLAEICLIRGHVEQAMSYGQEAQAFAGEVGGLWLQHQAQGYQARLALARGDLARARALTKEIGPALHEGINTWFTVEVPRLSQVLTLIRLADQASLAQADSLLATYLGEVEALHNVQRQVAALAVQALLHEAQGRRAAALMVLEAAVALAAARGYVRTLLDRGPTLITLLKNLAERGRHAAYLAQVLAHHTSAQVQAIQPASLQPSLALPEMLTRRELEILALLAERWSDKEIATRLVIAPNTVRKHTSTIFAKLGVNSRREAVQSARALGLLQAT
ncbi:MAG: LuxR C-terminal-related transcriptional regulator [Oscillochloridaceae bacterium umkhey_bin13]